MGGGHWTSSAVRDYTSTTRGMSLDDYTTRTFSTQEFFKSRDLAEELDPYKVVRECRDSKEHPNTLPVILALDVTGSMGDAAIKTAQALNEIMTTFLSSKFKDVEFCTMGIGDLAYDRVPIQMSQFESDIRIAEQLDKIYFEGGGGGNSYESYTAAWYMGLYHCKLDCWKRNKKGIIITMGDELPNPYLPSKRLSKVVGDNIQKGATDTDNLYKLVTKKFDVYHISIDDEDTCYELYNRDYDLDSEWSHLLGKDNYFVSSLNKLPAIITTIILKNKDVVQETVKEEEEEIEW